MAACGPPRWNSGMEILINGSARINLKRNYGPICGSPIMAANWRELMAYKIMPNQLENLCLMAAAMAGN